MRFVRALAMVAGVLLLVSGARQLVAAGSPGREFALDDVVLDPSVVHVVAELARAGRDASPSALSRLAGTPVCDADAPTVACADAVQVLGAAPAAGGAVIRPMPDVPGGSERIAVAVAAPDRARVLVSVVTRSRRASAQPSGHRNASPFAGVQLGAGGLLVVLGIGSIGHEQRRLRRQATIDALTGLPNRAEFEWRARAVLTRAARGGTGACLVLVDLDRFKVVNDSCGHTVGDRVLADAASRLRASVRETDLVGRWGGDEFLLLLPGAPDRDGFDARVAAIAASLGGIATVGGVELTGSVGTAMSPADGDDLPTLLEAADRAMYAAKLGLVRMAP